MALVLGTNSYVDVATADLYFADRLDVAAWTDASEAQKPRALITATLLLDDLKWAGVMSDTEQALAFPRAGTYFDPRAGVPLDLIGTLASSRLSKACMELAYHLLNNDGLLDDIGGLKTLSLGTLDLKGLKSAGSLPSVVFNLIRPMLVNNGVNAYWRNN